MSHGAVRNRFYELWVGRELDADAVTVVAQNYFARVSRTPVRIGLAFLNMTDPTARAETVENLYDEMGRGTPSRMHARILSEFLSLLLSRMRGYPVDASALDAPLLPSTARLITESEQLFSSPDPQVVCGALLAQEWHAYPQLVYMYEGVRNYRRYFDLVEFHESCEYFYLHIGATEKEHKAHSLSTAARACVTVRDIENLERGFYAYLDLLAANWDEIHDAIQSSGQAGLE
jgi:hypothetical protein